MARYSEGARKTNQTHTYQANSAVMGTGTFERPNVTGYVDAYKRIQKDSDPGPKRDAALTPLREQAKLHDNATRKWHHDNVAAADLTLTSDDLSRLDEVSSGHRTGIVSTDG